MGSGMLRILKLDLKVNLRSSFLTDSVNVEGKPD